MQASQPGPATYPTIAAPTWLLPLGDIAKRAAIGIKQRIDEADALAELLVDQSDEGRPKRRHRARSSYDQRLAVDLDAIAGCRVAVAGHVGNAAPGFAGGKIDGHIGPGLIGRQRKKLADSTTAGTKRIVNGVGRALVPDRLRGNRSAAHLNVGCAAGEDIGT